MTALLTAAGRHVADAAAAAGEGGAASSEQMKH